MSTHADYRQRAGKLEGDYRSWAGFRPTARSPAGASRLSGADVDVRAPVVVGAFGVGVRRRLAPPALLVLLRRAVALARDTLQALHARRSAG